jgi:hypothetical protein
MPMGSGTVAEQCCRPALILGGIAGAASARNCCSTGRTDQITSDFTGAPVIVLAADGPGDVTAVRGPTDNVSVRRSAAAGI